MKPTLVVLDATRLLMRNGPTGGSTADVKRGDTIAVATDQADWLRMAEERGLGTRNWRQLTGEDIQAG